MSIGQILLVVGAVLIVFTIRRPIWLGGPRRRYTADDTANATIDRASVRSLGMYLIFAGVLFWLVGL